MKLFMFGIGLIIIIVRVLSADFGKSCSASDDCDVCGVCIDKNPSETKCNYPYPETEVINDECKFKHDLCDGYLCENGGRCLYGFGFSGPVCICDLSSDFIGQHCEIDWKRNETNKFSLVGGLAVFFDQFRKKSQSLQVYSVQVFAAMFSVSREVQFYLETSEGFIIRFNRSTECSYFEGKRIYPYYPSCRSCPARLPTCTFLYQAKVQFPYKLASGPEMIMRSGSVIAYMANITLAAKSVNTIQKHQEIYRDIHPIMVNYEDLQPDQRQHMPIIELQNCGRNLNERIFYHRRSTISLNAKVKISKRELVWPVWTLWEVKKFRNEYKVPNKFQINRGYSWTLKPFTLKMNVYRIQLKVTVIFGLQSVANYAECYIEVIKSAVVAIISGGSTRTVNNKHPVTISGEKSYSPDNRKTNQNLKFHWKCISPHCENIIPYSSSSLRKFTIPKDTLEYNTTYIFKLKVSEYGIKDGLAFQLVYVSEEDMSIYCLMNCLNKMVPTDPLFMEVKLPSNEQLHSKFEWTINDEVGTIVNASNVKCKSHTFPSYLFCVESNTLNSGKTYYFHAKKANSSAIAALKVFVGKVLTFSCTVSPKEGVQSKTSFSISCSKPEGASSWTYEFFDKDDSDLDVTFSGRMIATNNLGTLRGFKLFRGHLFVYLLDIGGVISQWKQVIELTMHNATREEVDSLFAGIENNIDSHEIELALRKASLVSELISPRLDKTYIAKRMVHFICKIPYVSQRTMKLGLMTAKNFILSLTKEGDFKISPYMLRVFTQVFRSISQWTNYAMGLADTAVPSISDAMLEQMAKASVEVIEVVLANRNESFFDTNLEYFNPSSYEDALQASIQIEDSLGCIGRMLSFKHGTGYMKISVASSTNMSVVSAQSDYLKLVAKRINEDKNSSVRMSDKLVKELKNIEELSIQITTIRHNPFFSHTTRRVTPTYLLSLELYNKHSLNQKMTRVDYITNEIDLFIEEQSKISSFLVVVTQLDPTTKFTEDVDDQLTVLRLDLSSHSKLFLSFTLQNSHEELKIFVSEMVRPDFKMVNSSATIISSSNATYNKSNDEDDSDKFVYVGILPGPNVPVNDSVSVTIHFYYHLCLTWLRHNWESQYCRVGSNSNRSIIHCKCTHLSFFSAVFAVPPNEINPFSDISLFLTIKNNWFIVVLMACLLLSFFLLGLWAKCKDARDKLHRTVLVLEDNFPMDTSYYLLAVFTGCRINAGTDANIGVQIHGSESSSRSHILKSSKRKVLQRNSEDWFFVQTPEPLGAVAQIHVWSDNSGRSPDWYCNKLVVFDLQTTIVYTFFVEQWLAFEGNEFGEAVLFPASSEDMCDVKRIILENVTFGFREGDLSGSILARHPRSRIERLDRVVILMCFIMIALLVSLAFYKVSGEYDDEGIDDSGFSFESQDILISFQTFLISSFLIFLISVTFSKAYKPKHEMTSRGNARLFYTGPSRQHLFLKPTTGTISPTLSRKLDDNSYYHRLVRRMRRTFHTLPLSPIALSKSSAQVKTNRMLYFVAWLMSTLLITLCVFFIILYGLKLGQEESKKWVASITLVLVQEFLLISPLKIVVIGLILATAFERFGQISNYSVTIEDFLEKREANNEINYSLIVTARNHQMYKPLSVMESDVLRVKRTLRKTLHNLVDLLIVIAYIVIICLVTNEYSIKVRSYANVHISQMVQINHKSSQINFQHVHNRTQFYDYLDSTFITALYSIRWYNEEILEPPELKGQRRSMWWTMDKIIKLVGSPACRQIRVDPKKCSLNQITKNSSVECIPNWSPDVEDTDDYDSGWRIPTTYEAVHKESSAWKYVSSSQSDRLSRQGESWTTYHGGGYMISLSSDKFETERKVQILTESKWVNEFTRVVFLVFTLFNVNENMFTEVVLIAEHFPYGLYMTRTTINSVKLTMFYSVWKVGFILLILIMLLQIIKMLRLMNRHGFIKYFSEFVNIYQLLITGLGVVSILCFVVHIKVSLNYIEMFHRRGLDVFFEFDKIVYYSIISENSLTILFCCLSFRLLSLWPFGGRSLNIYNTLLLSGKSISRFLVLFCVHIFIFCRLVSYLLNQMLSISSFYWLWSKSVHKSASIGGLTVMFILSFSVKLCLFFMLMLFRYQYRLEKGKKVYPSDLTVFLKWITRQR